MILQAKFSFILVIKVLLFLNYKNFLEPIKKRRVLERGG